MSSRPAIVKMLALIVAGILPFVASAQDNAPAKFTGMHSRTSAENPATAYCDFGRDFNFRLYTPTNAAVTVNVETAADASTWSIDNGDFSYSPRLAENGSIRAFTFTLVGENGWKSEPKTITVKVKSKYAEITSILLKGLVVSIEIFVLTVCFSLPLGLVIAFGRMSKIGIIRQIFRIYISIMRGTPLMLQLFFFYFGPFYIFRIPITESYRFIAVIIGFSLNYAAYFAEIYRAGIESIPVGQYEAANVLGFGRNQTFFQIIFPQVVKRILPPVTNEVITLVKDTSLAFAISVAEMFTAAKAAAAADTTMIPFIIAGILYYIFNYVVAILMERVEKALSYYR